MIIKQKVQTNKELIPNTGRVERILSLIVFLNDWKSINEISIRLQISRKSVNRYINLLIRLGFEVERGHRKITFYRITNTKAFFNIQ